MCKAKALWNHKHCLWFSFTKNSGQIFTKFDHCYKYIPIILQSISSRESTYHERMKLYNKLFLKRHASQESSHCERTKRANKKNEQVWCERKNYTRQDEILR